MIDPSDLTAEAIRERARRDLGPLREKLAGILAGFRDGFSSWQHDDLKETLEQITDIYARVWLESSVAGWVSPWFPVLLEIPDTERGIIRNDPAPRRLAIYDVLEGALQFISQQIGKFPTRIGNLVSRSQFAAAAFNEQASDAMMERVNSALRDSIEAGEGRAEWRERLRGIVETRAGFDEAIQRTATHKAFYHAQTEALREPIIGDLFPYFQHYATLDGRQRPSHAALHELVFHKDSDLAQKSTDALDEWNCRCTRVPLTADDAEAKGIAPGGHALPGFAVVLPFEQPNPVAALTEAA